MTEDAELQKLAADFEARHVWWETIAVRADAAQKRHLNVYRSETVKHQEMDGAARGFGRAAALAEKAARAYMGDIPSLYRTQSALKQNIKDPLDGVLMSGKIALRKTGFWTKYNDFLQKGRYYRADNMLKNAVIRLENMNPVRRQWHKMRYTQDDRDAWNVDVEKAMENLHKYEHVFKNFARVTEEIATGEKIIARGIHKMLRDPAVRALLDNPLAQRMAKQSREFSFLKQCAAFDEKTIQGDIENAITGESGRITPQGVSAALTELHHRARSNADDRNEKALAAIRRSEKAERFASSARVMQRLETKTSKLVDGAYDDLRQALKNGIAQPEDERARLIRSATIKKRRWIDTANTERDVKMLESDDFDPADIKEISWSDYAVNAGLDGLKRSVTEFPARTLSASIEFTRNLFRNSWKSTASGSSTNNHSPRPNKRKNTQAPQHPPPPDPKLNP